jgi:hypothetical protein
MEIKIEFKLEDFWIGAFWKREPRWDELRFLGKDLHIWICIIPCLPIHIIRYASDEQA